MLGRCQFLLSSVLEQKASHSFCFAYAIEAAIRTQAAHCTQAAAVVGGLEHLAEANQVEES